MAPAGRCFSLFPHPGEITEEVSLLLGIRRRGGYLAVPPGAALHRLHPVEMGEDARLFLSVRSAGDLVRQHWANHL